MALANRIDPFGTLFATPERGSLLGNRGGRFHDPVSQTVKGRPYASRQWICCRLSFKDRHRTVWGQGYTELFFSDEIAALAAGHRPCFECRRADAMAFATAWGLATGSDAPKADAMDRQLDHERRFPGPRGGKRLHQARAEDLPDGAMILVDGRPHAIKGGALLRWRFAGYEPAGRVEPGEVAVLTPPSILACLRHGYQPYWPSLSTHT
jgi:hypothetical protein